MAETIQTQANSRARQADLDNEWDSWTRAARIDSKHAVHWTTRAITEACTPWIAFVTSIHSSEEPR